ncbi:MAG: glycoside hydrolase family 97 protein, partial [Firmicutes bacterium]|nr:glycoside hydrolase family 97 protein [Bacillota bacterium]
MIAELKNIPALLIIAVLGMSLTGCPAEKGRYTITSPDGKVEVELTQIEGKIHYQLLWEDKEMIAPSELSILPGVSANITASNVSIESETWEPVWGQFSQISNNYQQLTVDLNLDGTNGKLYVRTYDKGVGFRYELTGFEEGTEARFYCEYNLSGEDGIYSPAGEGEPLGPLRIVSLQKSQDLPPLRMPLVVERPDQKHMAILESDLFSAEGFEVMHLNFDQKKKRLNSDNAVAAKGESLVTPWRVVLLEENVGDLVTNTVPVNLATPNQLEDASWVRPGKTLWDWRVHGYQAPDGFTYGIDTESYLRFIDFAAEKGIEYFLIDDAWYTEAGKSYFKVSDKLNLEKVSKYAKEQRVGLILYYDRKRGNYGDKELFPYYKSLNMKGIKYGFMGEDVPFTRNAVMESAKNRLLIDFHDGPVPFTGIRRTFPNAITKEYCHAQQDSRRTFTPETFIKMALINAIQGPLDMNNGNFDISGINRGDRKKGPRILNSYITTVTAEVARTLIIFSGLVCIPDAPEAYKAKEDLFEFIQKLPVGKWDESRILHSKMGEYITTARRHNQDGFIGSVISQKGGILPITLD